MAGQAGGSLRSAGLGCLGRVKKTCSTLSASGDSCLGLGCTTSGIGGISFVPFSICVP